MNERKILGAVKNTMENSKKSFLCPICSHKNVCNKIEITEKQCADFVDATTYQRYSSIHHMFQPVFAWIKHHYPAGEVKFIVDHNSARMLIEHGPCVFSKEITEFAIQNQGERESEVKENG